ncbi:alpha/beta fold hydrolase [Pseudonocardia xinjiangensis]|uniref:alpha/beta fold hydrolase n=1 Tax=Pseudonocardia xinjiangensis TaxID=75289 RepID=UPI003D94BCB8
MASIYRTQVGRESVARWCSAALDAWSVPHVRHTVIANGVNTHLVTAGAGERAVLMVPGTNFNAATYLPLATALAERFRVYLPDVPGQPGLSDGNRPPARGRLSWYGRWLTEVLGQLEDSSITVVGHSLGAAIALASDSTRADRQVLVSPGGLTRLAITPRVLTTSIVWSVRRRPIDSARLLQTMHGPTHSPRPELTEWMTLVARNVRSSADPGRVTVTRRDVDRIAVTGEHDVFLPPVRLAPATRHALGVELHVIPAAGHLVVDEYPSQIAVLVDQHPVRDPSILD